MKRIQILLSCIILASIMKANDPLIQNVYNRNTTSLNGKWNYIIDPYELGYYGYRYEPRDQFPNPGPDAFFTDYKTKNKSDRVEYDFDKSPVMNIPGDWNSQNNMLFYYEGTIWFKKSFDYTKKKPGNRIFIHFGAVNYRADVYLNGIKLGYHEGGFTPFNFEVTDIIKSSDNFLIVKVDNKRKREAVPTLNTDWWNYGGITRDVNIIETSDVFISDYKVQLKKGESNIISGYVLLDGNEISDKKVSVNIPGLNIHKEVRTNDSGYGTFEIKSDKIEYWSSENPKRYLVILQHDVDQIEDKIGFRTIQVSGQDILLNKEPVFLKGICIHEENPIRGGRAFCREDAVMLLTWVKELGCNFVRLAHYPHNEHIIQLADEMGIMIWEENPVYWTVLFDREETFVTASNQLKEVITRDKNRASVIIWSMANETPLSDERFIFLTRLIDTTRKMDNSRIISAALEIHGIPGKENTYTISDPIADHVDILSFNEYIGWYNGLPDKCSKITWEIKQNKPVFISEFGGGALFGYHGDAYTRWSEEYQEFLYKESLKMLQKIPQLRGMSPWILTDFRSPRRLLPVIQDGWNRKGLISERGQKKKAFYILRKFYNEIEK